MVSEPDLKYLGIYAKQTSSNSPELSAALYKVLGLSTLLNRKLLRARKQRKLDPTRATKSLDLYKHINWMGMEGYNIIETIIPHIDSEFEELRVLVHKLKASFLHVFVLFEFSPKTKGNVSAAQQTNNPAARGGGGGGGVTVKETTKEANYIRRAAEAFKKAHELSADLLPGIHPLRLSVIVEYTAFTFDCLRDYPESRRLAKKGVEDALEEVDIIDDDETFAEAQDLVGSLAIMAKRASPTNLPVHGPPNLAQAASHGDLKTKNSKKTYDMKGKPIIKAGA